MFDRRLIENFDWGFLITIALICGVGLIILYSAVSAGYEGIGLHSLFKKQAVWMGAGFCIMMMSLVVDFREFDKLHLFIYVLCVGLLVSTYLFGQMGGGSRRWLVLGFIRMQPSELMKISLIISLASVYSDKISQEGLGFRNLVKPAVYCLIPFGLIVNQPDLGTGLLLLVIAGSITLFVKVEKKVFLPLQAWALPLCRWYGFSV